MDSNIAIQTEFWRLDLSWQPFSKKLSESLFSHQKNDLENSRRYSQKQSSRCVLNLGYLNNNSLRNKLELLRDQIIGKIDVLVISETKLCESFPEGLFKMLEYASSLPFDWDYNGSDIIASVRGADYTQLLSAELKLCKIYKKTLVSKSLFY